MKKIVPILLFLLISMFPVAAFAESYDFNSGEISINVDDSEWIVITSDNYHDYEDALGDLYGEIESLLTNGSYYLVAVSSDKDYYWTFGYSSQDQNVDFSAEDDEEIMSIYDEDLTNGEATASDIKASIYETNGYKYLVGDTIIDEGDYTTGAVQYMTGVGKTFYVFVAYSYDENRLTDDQKKEMESLLDDVSYSIEPATEPVSGGGNSFWTAFGKRFLYTTLLIVAISIVRFIWSSIKHRDEDILTAVKEVEDQKNEENDSTISAVNETDKEAEDNIHGLIIEESVEPADTDVEVIEEQQEADTDTDNEKAEDPILQETIEVIKAESEHKSNADDKDDAIEENFEPLDSLYSNPAENIEDQQNNEVENSKQEHKESDRKGYVYNLSEIIKAGGYKTTDYQKILDILNKSEKYKDKMSEYSTGVYITGDRDEILSELKQLIIDNQYEDKSKQVPASTESVRQEEIPEKQLRQLKELFDAGVLTEEEFKEKKRKLLNL